MRLSGSFISNRDLLSGDLAPASVTRIRGFTLEVLRALLQSNPQTVTELSERLGRRPNYIRAYLYRLKRYGYVDCHLGHWYLTERGRSAIEKLESLLPKRSQAQRSEAITVGDALEHLRRYGLSSRALAVALKLIENYARSGFRRKYMVFTSPQQMEEEFEMSIDDVREAVRELESKGIAYRYPIKGYGLKLGLMEGFVRELLSTDR